MSDTYAEDWQTLLEVMSRATPSGINAIPTAKNTGSTVPAVIIGCHAGNFCCFSFESTIVIIEVNVQYMYYNVDNKTF